MNTVVSLIGNHPRRIGGTEEFARELSSQLGRLGWNSVLCFPNLPAPLAAEYLSLPNVTFEVVRDPWVNSFDAVDEMARILRRHRPRILHCMFTEFISPFPWLAKACGVERVYFTDQGSQPEDYIPGPAPLWKRIAYRLINRPLTGVIAISDYNARGMCARNTYPPGR